ncbi:MAG: acetyltransferase [Cyclobacteriaceae bacterium]|nr:acetyltransferase [Cyclobacteriaceae bacterium]
MTKGNKNIAIVGAGGLGKEILVLIQQLNLIKPTWNVIGYYDDNFKDTVAGTPVLGNVSMLNTYAEPLAVIVALGNPFVKQEIVNKLVNPKLYFPILIHPQATVGMNVKIEHGTIITAGCRLTVDINLGRHVLINLNSTIGHDVSIGDFTSVMPGVHISGNVLVGSEVMIGTGASVLQRITIGDGATVGAAALVTTNVKAGSTVIGIPAREK